MAFNVTVRSEPDQKIKGVYQCEIVERGLILTRRKKETIEIPRGSESEYLGKNRFQVSVNDERLDITVAKFGNYQNSLTRDIAAFVRGDGDAPVMSDYRLPWYFYVVCVLPIGIPAITFGGAIPGAIGGGLAMACLAVAQREEWSIPKRLALAFGLVLAGYLALFALLLMTAN